MNLFEVCYDTISVFSCSIYEYSSREVLILNFHRKRFPRHDFLTCGKTLSHGRVLYSLTTIALRLILFSLSFPLIVCQIHLIEFVNACTCTYIHSYLRYFLSHLTTSPPPPDNHPSFSLSFSSRISRVSQILRIFTKGVLTHELPFQIAYFSSSSLTSRHLTSHHITPPPSPVFKPINQSTIQSSSFHVRMYVCIYSQPTT